METKQWYYSRTVWSQLVAVICMGLSFTWVIDLDEAMQGSIIDTIMAGTLVFSQILAIYYRIKAKKELI